MAEFMDTEVLEPVVSGVLGGHGVEFAFSGGERYVAVGDAAVGMEDDGYFPGSDLQGVGVVVQAGEQVGGLLGVFFKEIGVDDLEAVGFNLFPAEGSAVLSEANELC